MDLHALIPKAAVYSSLNKKCLRGFARKIAFSPIFSRDVAWKRDC